LLLCAVALAAALPGGAIGAWIGLVASPGVAVGPADCSVPPTPDVDSLAGLDPWLIGAVDDSLHSGVQLAARLDSVEHQAARLNRHGLTPREGAITAVEGLGESDLKIIASMLAGLEDDDLVELQDLRGFASRLTEIAIEGELEGVSGDEIEIDTPLELLFAAEEEIQNPRLVAAREFSSETHRIFAIVRTRDVSDRRLMVRWARVDRPHILELQSQPVSPTSNWTAFAHAPHGSWRAGRYQVSVYGFDSEMKPLASQTFTVEGAVVE
jgi:hypothetical protein